MDDQNKNSILIVDDEKASIMTLTHILTPEYSVYAAKNGLDAIRIAEKFSPDLILLDIRMPEMDGYEVLSLLKNSQAAKNIPVIFITGFDDKNNEEKKLSFEVAGYITKPFSAGIVKLRLRNQIGVQRAGKVKKVQRRNCFRISCSLPVTIERPRAEKAEELAEGQIIDICDGGMLFISSEDIERAEEITLSFDIGSDETITGFALRTEPVGANKYKTAVQFKHKGNMQKDRIYRGLLKEQMKKQRHKKEI
jgi:CheY-like chemotaxis protein